MTRADALRVLMQRAALALGDERAEALRPLLEETSAHLALLWRYTPRRDEEPFF